MKEAKKKNKIENGNSKLVKIMKDLIFRINDDQILALGSQLAYSFLFAFFPF